MATLGVICPTVPSHLYVCCALGHALAARGHRVVVFGTPAGARAARDAGLDFHALTAQGFATAADARRLERVGESAGLRGLWQVERLIAARTRLRLATIPDAARRIGVDAFIVDQSSPDGGTVAERLGVPFVTVCGALMLNRDALAPPFTSGRLPGRPGLTRLANRLGWAVVDAITSPSRAIIARHRRRWRLPPRPRADDLHSTLAQLCQQPEAFEFPRAALPRCLHFTGPFEGAAVRAAVPFPFERLSGRPLVYASMGTVFNRRPAVLRCIAGACAGLDVQLVITTGGAPIPRGLAGDPLVVDYAPQLELLSRAALCISHGGIGTVLQSLARGVPVVAIPVSSDQPGIAARLVWSGAGARVPLARLDAARLRGAVTTVLGDARYREQAGRLRDAIGAAGGVDRAADVVERVVASGEPVWAR